MTADPISRCQKVRCTPFMVARSQVAKPGLQKSSTSIRRTMRTHKAAWISFLILACLTPALGESFRQEVVTKEKRSREVKNPTADFQLVVLETGSLFRKRSSFARKSEKWQMRQKSL